MGILDAPGLTKNQGDQYYIKKDFVTVAGLFADATPSDPVIIPHRGAGDLVAPENTLEGFRAGHGMGLGIIDGGDLWPLMGGTYDIACSHNSTVDSMTTQTGNVSDFTPEGWRNLAVDAGGPNGWFGGQWGADPSAVGGYRALKTMTFNDILREFAGKTVLTPEPKGTGTHVATTLEMIQRYGAERSTLVQHFSHSQLTAFAAAGCSTMWLSTNGTNATKDDVYATGTRYVCFDYLTVSDATVSAWVADGRFTVGIYTASRHWIRDKYAALGVKFYMAGSPVYLTKDTAKYRTSRDTFASGDYYHGHMSNLEFSLGAGGRGFFESGGWLTWPSAGSGAIDASTLRNTLMGGMCPLPDATTYTLDMDVRYGTLPTDTTRYATVIFGCPEDKAFFAVGTDKGYQLLLRANGTLALFFLDGGGTTTTGPTKATGAITAGTVAHLKIEVTATQIKAYRTDAGSTDSTALTWTHSGLRGAYFHIGRVDGSGGPMVVSYKNVIRT